MNILDMLPDLTGLDIADPISSDFILGCKYSLRKIAGANSQNIGFGEFDVPIGFSNGSSSPFNHFSHVSVVITQMQMGRLNANGPITPVQNKLTVRDRSVVDAIGDLVDCERVTSEGQLSISSRISGRARPVPASLGRRRGRRRFSGHVPAKSFSFSKPFGSIVSLARERIAMSMPSVVMDRTPRSGDNGPITSVYRTGHAFHSSGVIA